MEIERKSTELKKIAIVAQGASEGGAERVATLLANYLANKKYEVYFYAVYSGKREYYIDERVNYHYCNTKAKFGPLRMLERAIKVRKFILKNQIDTMISFVYMEGLFLVGSKQIKKIYSLRNDPVKARDTKLQKKLRDKIYQKADCIVFQTPDARDYFGPPIRDRGTVIPNPVKPELPYWNSEGHGKEILAAGRLTAQKNFAMLIEGFAAFAGKHPEYRLTICGEGELKASLTAQAKQLGVEDKISFPGFVADIHRRMRDAEIYVSTSDYEGISNSMLEALALGIPVIATDCPCGGSRMYIRQEVNGLLVPTGNVTELSGAMLRLAGDPQLGTGFGREGQKLKETLGVSQIADRFLVS